MNWKEDYEKMLLEASGYSGNRKAGQKIISASSLGNDDLQLFLDYKHGKKEDTKFEASNLGSIFQLGVDLACENHRADRVLADKDRQYNWAQRYTHELPNGWTVSGEIDQEDLINKVIIDNKVSTQTALRKVKSEGKDHQYALQLAVYKYLIWKTRGEHFEGALAFIDKAASYFKPTSGDTMNYVDVETYNYEEIEAMLIEKSNKLQEYIDLDVEPDICANRFPFTSKGVTKPMRCLYYCSFNDKCKHFNEYTQEHDIVSRLSTPAKKANPYDDAF